MKKVICFSMASLLILVSMSPLVSSTEIHARPLTDETPGAYGPPAPGSLFPGREIEVEVLTAQLLSGSRHRGSRFQPSYEFMTSHKVRLVGFQDDPQDCSRFDDEILRQLDRMGIELEKVEKLVQSMSRGAGVTEDALRSPVLRTTFRRTFQQVLARLGPRAGGLVVGFLTGPLGWIFDLLGLVAIFDIAMENYIREDLMANNPSLTEDEARAWAEDISDSILELQAQLNSALGIGGASALAEVLHRIELFADQRSCRLHGNRGPRKPPPPLRRVPTPGSPGIGIVIISTPGGVVNLGCYVPTVIGYGPMGIPIIGWIRICSQLTGHKSD